MHPWLSSFVPITTIGSYYGITDSWHLTQLEILVSLPLFLCAWFCWREWRGNIRRAGGWFISGACAAVATIFKLVLAPIPIGIWLVVCLARIRKEEGRARHELLLDLAAAFLGCLITLGLVAVLFASNEALSDLWYTTFVYPLQALVDAPGAGLKRLIGSSLWFGGRIVFIFCLTAVVVFNWRTTRNKTMTMQMLSWLILGFGVILIQRFSYWQYHFMLLIFPLGILSVKGIDIILSNYTITNNATGLKTKPAIIALLLILIIFIPIIPRFGKKCINFAVELKKGTSWSQEYQRNLNATYKYVFGTASFLLLIPKTPSYP